MAIVTHDEGSGAAVDGSVCLATDDADVPANSNADRPRVLRSKLTLQGGVHGGSCHVDRQFMAVARPGDDLFIGLSDQGGVAVSVVRDGLLVIAAGTVSAVPLGRDVSVRIAADRWEETVGNSDLIPFDVPLRAPRVPFGPRVGYAGEWPMEVRVASREVLLSGTTTGQQVQLACGVSLRGDDSIGGYLSGLSSRQDRLEFSRAQPIKQACRHARR